MIVWGGRDGPSSYLDTGAAYDPGTDTWTPLSTANAPSVRGLHTVVWTGSRMIVWGGYDGAFLNTGAAYDPATDTWATLSTVNAPSGRYEHTAVWTGSRMVVWGGQDGSPYTNTGAAYDAAGGTWTPVTMVNAPSGRSRHGAVWTGSRMIVWGGWEGASHLGTGAAYEPVTDTWTGTATTNAPSGRYLHTTVWTGSRMIVWGGLDEASYVNTGGVYDPGQFFHTLTPCRLVDTRWADGPLGGPALAANTNRDFVVVGECGIPATAAALSVNLAVTAPAATGHFRLYPGGTTPPTVSSLNYSSGQTRGNNAIVKLGAAGDVGVRCVQASGTAHAVIDVNGYFEY
jgi:hypothetical protein